MMRRPPISPLFPYTTLFFFNDTATTEIYTLSLHDALPSHPPGRPHVDGRDDARRDHARRGGARAQDRKSTRLNSSHGSNSYARLCFKKKKNTNKTETKTMQINYRTKTGDTTSPE